MSSALVHDDVLELPGIFSVPAVLSQLIAFVLERVPVSVVPLHWTDVLVLHLKTTSVVNFIRLN